MLYAPCLALRRGEQVLVWVDVAAVSTAAASIIDVVRNRPRCRIQGGGTACFIALPLRSGAGRVVRGGAHDVIRFSTSSPLAGLDIARAYSTRTWD